MESRIFKGNPLQMAVDVTISTYASMGVPEVPDILFLNLRLANGEPLAVVEITDLPQMGAPMAGERYRGR